MELRNGKKYFPDLENHYIYSFQHDGSKRSPKSSPRIRRDVGGAGGKSRQHLSQNSRQKTNTKSAHSKQHVGSASGVAVNSWKEEAFSVENFSKKKEIDLRDVNVLIGKSNVDSVDGRRKRKVNTMILNTSPPKKTNRRTSVINVNNVYEFEVQYKTFQTTDCIVKTSTPIERVTKTSSVNNMQAVSIKERTSKKYSQRISKSKKTELRNGFSSDGNQSGFLNSLEDHIFHDTSYKKVATLYQGRESDKDVRNSFLKYNDESFHYLYKLNGSCLSNFSDYSDSEEEIFDTSGYVDHYKRSVFRQKRRDWYLNRRNLSSHRQANTIYQFLRMLKIMIVSMLYRSSSIFITTIQKAFYILTTSLYQKKLIAVTHSIIKILRQVFMKVFLRVGNVVQKVSETLLIWIKDNTSKKLIGLVSYVQCCMKNLFTRAVTVSQHVNVQLLKVIEHVFTGGKYFMTVCFTSTKSFFYYWYQCIIYRLKSLFYIMGTTDKDLQNGKVPADESDENGFFLLTPYCCFSLLAIIGMVPILLFLLAFFSQVSLSVVPDPNNLAISKSEIVFLGTSANSIPAWHFIPPSAEHLPSGSVFKDKSPITLYLREGEELNSELQANIFKTLVSLGYHVIVPINVLNSDEVSMAWSWIKQKAPDSSVYLWGDHLDSSTLTGYAKDFCTQLIPPDGVIIETEVKNNFGHRSLEIWSCNCTYVERKNDDDLTDYHKYTHVKCPLSNLDISLEQVYNYIVSCIAAVNRSER